ncbi:MAG: hypothetical protein AUG51_02185 [Acidobacteria bacterium 13_1_20CM_3_53_8]|nr:MAG: hypothetical protein AUG51_02185 [Acidobacteria bacterium 13_1_20CM_3_53_8]
MIERLTNAEKIRDAERRIGELIEKHAEWFFSSGSGGAHISLRKSDFDFSVVHNRLIFSCWTERGAQVWRIVGWESFGGKLLLEAARRTGAERAKLELIPRAKVSSGIEVLGESRRERCERLARLACELAYGARIERVGLSAGSRPGQPGRYARIILRLRSERIAVAGTVAESDAYNIDALLSSTLIWFARLSERMRPPFIKRLWLIVSENCAEAVARRVALLRNELRRAISIYEIDGGWQKLTHVRALEPGELWSSEPEKFRKPPRASLSELARKIVALAPEAIDVVRARHGETLRYNGLAFARVRRVMNRDRVWFGVEGSRRRVLDDESFADWNKLLDELKRHRRAEAEDHRHMLYRLAPEAWLESILRRDITRLDPGLIIAPLYAQFRTSRATGAAPRPIDLLALRREGRLVVIELKVKEDREHVFQGVDYWQRIEAHRRSGEIARARLFGVTRIADEPPIVYLVAPVLRFHRAFQTLARCINPEIEIYRFDINEDWRDGVHVVRRARAN